MWRSETGPPTGREAVLGVLRLVEAVRMRGMAVTVEGMSRTSKPIGGSHA